VAWANRNNATGALFWTCESTEEERRLVCRADARLVGCFTGSGVDEAGCRTLIGQQRMCSGILWSMRGANAVIVLRCCQLLGRFEDF
jgi:hypothetical protein